jgi:hypothetical protein
MYKAFLSTDSLALLVLDSAGTALAKAMPEAARVSVK